MLFTKCENAEIETFLFSQKTSDRMSISDLCAIFYEGKVGTGNNTTDDSKSRCERFVSLFEQKKPASKETGNFYSI